MNEFQSKSNELTKIERELVLQYLRDDNVPVTVTLEEKPLPVEAEVQDGKTATPDDSERIPPSALFPVALPAEQLTVLDQGIILLKNATREVKPFIGKTVRIQFYFHRLGLYFLTTMKEYSKGLAIVVPAKICRVEEPVQSDAMPVTLSLSYTVSGGSLVNIPCRTVKEYPLLVQPKWSDIPLEQQGKAKALLEGFVAQKDVSIGSGLHLMPVCKYLSLPNVQSDAIEGARKAPCIIFVDDKRLVAVVATDDATFSKENEFSVSISFTLGQNARLKRNVLATVKVDCSYADKESKEVCAVLSFTDMRTEDARFISERMYGRKKSNER